MTYAADLLDRLRRTDPTRPRLTTYDDAEGPTRGERIELSARVLDNWVAKAANLLQDEVVEPGSVVLLDAPAHWRTAYWALATWSVGATLALSPADGPADLTISTDPAAPGLSVLLTLPALVRAAPGPVPAGVIDEARELSGYADTFVAYLAPEDDAPAAVSGGRSVAYDQLATWASAVPDGARVHLRDPDRERFLRALLGAFAADGSLVLSRGGADEEALARRAATEGVTLEG